MSETEVGTCALCGQRMLRTADDCWHPWDVATACPPEDQRLGFTAAQWGTSGRPGAEHFQPHDPAAALLRAIFEDPSPTPAPLFPLPNQEDA